MSSEALWYLARGSGVVTLILLTVVVVLGVTTRSAGTFGSLTGRSRLVVASVHRSSALLAVVFLTIHIVTLSLDPYAQLKLVDLVVPFTSSYRPLFVGLGTIALDLIVAITLTSLFRPHLGRRAWRAVHLAAYALWPIALLHGIGSGTDHTRIWMIGIDAACVAAVLAALAAHPAITGTSRPQPETVTSVPAQARSREGAR